MTNKKPSKPKTKPGKTAGPVKAKAKATANGTDTSNTDQPRNFKPIEFNVAVLECEKAFAKFDSSVREANMRLGEIAANCETKYGDDTLNNLGKKLEAKIADKEWAGVFSDAGKVKEDDGIADCTLGRMLKRNCTVFRAWESIKAPGAFISWSVMRELQSHPERAELVEQNPTMTKAEAREIMRAYKKKLKGDDQDADDKDEAEDEDDGEGKDKDPDDQDAADKDWQKQTKKWLSTLLSLANEIEDASIEYPKDPAVVRKYASIKLLPTVQEALVAWRGLTERLVEDLGVAENDTDTDDDEVKPPRRQRRDKAEDADDEQETIETVAADELVV